MLRRDVLCDKAGGLIQAHSRSDGQWCERYEDVVARIKLQDRFGHSVFLGYEAGEIYLPQASIQLEHLRGEKRVSAIILLHSRLPDECVPLKMRVAQKESGQCASQQIADQGNGRIFPIRAAFSGDRQQRMN